MEVSLDTCGRRMVKSLLLLYLFVVRAAADCPKPQGTENIVLTNEALLKNDFPEGSEATFECANGYAFENGSGTATCTNGEWTTPKLNCKKRDCGLPRLQPHMHFVVTEGTLFGASLQVYCDEGYRLSGTSYKKCYAAGWSGKAKCGVVTCAKPDEVTNGRNFWDSQTDPIYGDTVQYVCDEGYTLTGNHTIKCSGNGQYNSPPPECNGVIFPADILSTEDEITTTRKTPTASPPVQGKHGDVDTNKDIGYTPVIVSVISIGTVVPIVVFILHHFLLKRKGSYDTGEDLKPELLQFQNL
ncbi:complement factor H isoform X3 [Centroberyx gerrardi]